MSTYRLVGIMWLFMGLALDNTALWVMGLVFLILSLND